MTKPRSQDEGTRHAAAADPAPSSGTRPLFKQGFLYGVVGAAQLGADWLAFVMLSYFGLEPALANVLGRVVGASLGFVLNGRFTFRQIDGSTHLHVRSLSRFAISWLAMTALSTLLVTASVSVFGLETTWITKPMIDAILAAAGFVASKYWIYR
ncbi:MAG: GtrA family protein [Pseudoxanthomonas sp.]